MTDIDNPVTDHASGIPVLPLRDVVVFPHMVIPLFVGREKSIEALEKAMEGDKRVLLVAQKDAGVDDPGQDDIFNIGTVSTILQMLKLPDGTVKVLVEGGERATINSITENDFYTAEVTILDEGGLSEDDSQALMRALSGQFEQYGKLSKKIPAEIASSLSGIIIKH